jgi:hypothetical protein
MTRDGVRRQQPQDALLALLGFLLRALAVVALAALPTVLRNRCRRDCHDQQCKDAAAEVGVHQSRS